MAEVESIESAELPGGGRHPVHRNPVSHIRRETQEPLKTWSGSYQPLPMPRLLLTPYIGCSAGCDFCFIQGFPGLYHMADRDEILTVFENYPDHVRDQLDRLRVAPPALLSPFTDPFQPINDRYQLSEHLVKELVMLELPVDMVTRYHVPDEVVAMLKHVPSARIQFSIDPFRREGNVPDFLERLNAAERIHRLGIDVAVRLDPLFPPVEEISEAAELVVREATDRDLDQVVVGFGQVPPNLYGEWVEEYREDFQKPESGGGIWTLRDTVKTSMLESVAEITSDHNAHLGVLGEPELQDEFGSFGSPFREMLPLSYRRSDEEPFQPLGDCPGDCFRCPEAVCGIEELRGTLETHRNCSTAQWDEWGQGRLQEELIG